MQIKHSQQREPSKSSCRPFLLLNNTPGQRTVVLPGSFISSSSWDLASSIWRWRRVVFTRRSITKQPARRSPFSFLYVDRALIVSLSFFSVSLLPFNTVRMATTLSSHLFAASSLSLFPCTCIHSLAGLHSLSHFLSHSQVAAPSVPFSFSVSLYQLHFSFGRTAAT